MPLARGQIERLGQRLSRELQDLWAQISEKMADQYGLEVKYGGGPDVVNDFLTRQAGQGAQIEDLLSCRHSLNARL